MQPHVQHDHLNFDLEKLIEIQIHLFRAAEHGLNWHAVAAIKYDSDLICTANVFSLLSLYFCRQKPSGLKVLNCSANVKMTGLHCIAEGPQSLQG